MVPKHNLQDLLSYSIQSCNSVLSKAYIFKACKYKDLQKMLFQYFQSILYNLKTPLTLVNLICHSREEPSCTTLIVQPLDIKILVFYNR